jgi:hypothetical protein
MLKLSVNHSDNAFLFVERRCELYTLSASG